MLLQPASVEANTDSMYTMFDQWAEEIGKDHPEASAADWVSFRSNMWDGEFVITVSPDDVAAMTTPILVMMGNDHFHPPSISRRITALAPNGTLVEEWKGDQKLPSATRSICCRTIKSSCNSIHTSWNDPHITPVNMLA